MKKCFTTESMLEVTEYLNLELTQTAKVVSFEVLNPDCAQGVYAGKSINIKEKTYLYRGYKAWTDLAELLFCRMLTPVIVDEDMVLISFEKLNIEESFHSSQGKEEKYGVDSPFFEINKNEEPAFLLPYKHALKNVKIQNRKCVLDLGVNSGDELHLIKEISADEDYSNTEFIGIDYSASAIDFAKKTFSRRERPLHRT